MNRIISLVNIFLLSAFLSKTYGQCLCLTTDSLREYYEIGRLSRLVDRIQCCRKDNPEKFLENEKANLIYLTKSYLALDSNEVGEKYMTRLIQSYATYQVNKDQDPLRYIRTYEEVKRKMSLNEISSVTKKAMSIDKVPATVYVLNGDEIKRRGYNSFSEILSDLPGFHTSQTNGILETTFNVRGTRSSNMSDKIMILLDGVEHNELFTQFAWLGNEFPVSLIDKIEVIYGPATSMYGANAANGVISITTKNIFQKKLKNENAIKKYDFMTSVEGRLSTNSLNSQFLDLATGVKYKEFQFQLNGRYFQTQGFDLSEFPNWDGKIDFSREKYYNNLTDTLSNIPLLDSFSKDPLKASLFVFDSDSIRPTNSAINLAIEKDSMAYFNPYYGNSGKEALNPNVFSDPSNGYSIGFSAKILPLTFQVYLSGKTEGVAPDYIDDYTAINSDHHSWNVNQQFFSVRYKKSYDKLTVNANAYYRLSDFGSRSRLTFFNGYGNKKKDIFNLLEGDKSEWRQTRYFQFSKQYRSDLNFYYQLNEKHSALFGLEGRSGVFQKEYLKLVDRENLPLSYDADVTREGILSNPQKGGNFLDIIDFGIYSEYYINSKRSSVTLGARLDRRLLAGLQPDFLKLNPRISWVYSPLVENIHIFKIIGSQSIFVFPSFTQYTSSGSRHIPEKLEPEVIQNIEFAYILTPKLSNFKLNLSSFLMNSMNSLGVDKKEKNGVIKDMFLNNKGVIQIRGIQAEGTYNFKIKDSRILKFHFNGIITKGYSDSNEMGNRYIHLNLLNSNSYGVMSIGQVPEFNAFIGLSYPLMFYRLGKLKNYGSIFLSYNAVGKRFQGKGTTVRTREVLTEEFNSFGLLNANISLNISNDFNLQIRSLNLLNNQSIRHLGVRTASEPQSTFVPQPGRRVNFVVSFQF